MATCSTNGCNLDAFESKNMCALHCDKSDYETDGIDLLSTFSEQLIIYIADYFFRAETPTSDLNRNDIINYLDRSGRNRQGNTANTALQKSTIVFWGIFFPQFKQSDPFNYERIFKKIGSAIFKDCAFTSNSINIDKVKFSFDKCGFFEEWKIYNLQLDGSMGRTLYQECTFHKQVKVTFIGDDRYKIDNSLFDDCYFNSDLIFHNIKFGKPVFDNSEIGNHSINNFEIVNCSFDDRFILNLYKISSINIIDSYFNKKFEFKNNQIYKFDVVNSNFDNIFDSFESKFKKFNVGKCIFGEFVGFEHCEFGDNDYRDSHDLRANFKYVTFTGFINFRNAQFYNGLDIRDINNKEYPNFLGAHIESQHCNRETFRIIKYSFDKIGNHIEANKYFAEEMKKYSEELKNRPTLDQEKLILILNCWISDFGQNYWRPMGLIILTASVYYLLEIAYTYNILYEILPTTAGDIIDFLFSGLNGLSKNILPFEGALKQGMETVSLLFHVIFSALIWQTVVAIKRHTRR